MKSILGNLNVAQREAVLYENKPLLIIAGPGSGKTGVITHRIAYLIRQRNIQPHCILAATFTKKAATEMKNRLEALIGDRSCESLWAGTFHSLGLRILRQDINLERLCYIDPVSVYDPDDGKTIIQRILGELGYDLKPLDRERKRVLRHKIKVLQKSISDYKKANAVPTSTELRKVFLRYQEMLKDDNAIDFDDMLVLPVRLFEEYPEILRHYQEKFQHVFVDEYQDTNKIQNKLIRLLSGKYQAVTVVGDDDQSIYAFRGADVTNILQFEQEYNAYVIRLEQNYRSTRKIVAAASKMIQNNSSRLEKGLWTENEEGEVLTCYEAESQFEEAEWIGNQIKELKSQDISYSDCAVFYRTNQQANEFDKTFSRMQIPFEIVGGLGFFERREIKDILAYLKVICNPTDTLSLERIIQNTSCGIGSVTLMHLRHFAEARNVPLFEAIQQFDGTNFPPRIKNRVRRFIEIFEGLTANNKAGETLNTVLGRTKYLQKLQDSRSVQAETRGRNVVELIERIQDYELDNPEATIGDFLIDSALIAIGGIENDDATPRVNLMTLHKSKGLEFAYVFIAGCEQGLIPYDRKSDEADEYEAGYREAIARSLEEERRLFYVGATRAMKQIFLVHARERFLYGLLEYRKRSPFIDEIPNSLLDFKRRERKVIREAPEGYGYRKFHRYVPIAREIILEREMILEAVEMLRIREHEGTARLLQEMIAMNSGFDEAYCININRGCDRLEHSEFEDASIFLEEAIAINPEFDEARYILGIVYLKLSELEDSLPSSVYLDEAEEVVIDPLINPDLAKGYRELLEAKTELYRQFLEVVEDQRFALQKNIKRIQNFENSESHYKLEFNYRRANDPEEYRDDPAFPYAHCTLAADYLEQNRFEQAKIAVEIALSMDPNYQLVLCQDYLDV